MNTIVTKIVMWVPAAILVGLVCFGAYSYYFKKPVPIVNNTTVQPGATLNVEQGKQQKSDLSITAGPIFLDGKVGAMLGFSWRF